MKRSGGKKLGCIYDQSGVADAEEVINNFLSIDDGIEAAKKAMEDELL